MTAKAIKKTVPPEEALAAKKEQLAVLLNQCYQVERMLGICTDQHNRLDAEGDDLLRDIALAEQRAESAERSLDENVAFMKNYTKQSEEQLKVRHDRLTKTVAEAEAANVVLRQRLMETQEKKEAELRRWENEADAMQHQMDEKALLFGMQLKESLERMRA